MTDPRPLAIERALTKRPEKLTIEELLAVADSVDPVRAQLAEIRELAKCQHRMDDGWYVDADELERILGVDDEETNQ